LFSHKLHSGFFIIDSDGEKIPYDPRDFEDFIDDFEDEDFEVRMIEKNVRERSEILSVRFEDNKTN
jgi:hypothetical protein